MRYLDITAMTLLIIGGLNWGLVGFFGFNMVGWLTGESMMLSRIIYGLVGLAGLYEAATLWTIKHRWHCTATARPQPARY